MHLVEIDFRNKAHVDAIVDMATAHNFYVESLKLLIGHPDMDFLRNLIRLSGQPIPSFINEGHHGYLIRETTSDCSPLLGFIIGGNPSCMIINPVHTQFETRQSTIHFLLIDRQHTGKGIGTALVNKYMEKEMERGYRTFTVKDAETVTVRFWNKFGFAECGPGSLVDCVNMFCRKAD